MVLLFSVYPGSTYDNSPLNLILLRMFRHHPRCTFLLSRWGDTPTICLRLSVTQMLLPLGCITMTIAATRMHRSLVDYASGSPDMYDTFNFRFFSCFSAREMSFLVYSRISNWAVASHSPSSAARTASISPPNRIELTVHPLSNIRQPR